MGAWCQWPRGAWAPMPSPHHVLLLYCFLQGPQEEQGLRVGLPVALGECHECTQGHCPSHRVTCLAHTGALPKHRGPSLTPGDGAPGMHTGTLAKPRGPGLAPGTLPRGCTQGHCSSHRGLCLAHRDIAQVQRTRPRPRGRCPGDAHRGQCPSPGDYASPTGDISQAQRDKPRPGDIAHAQRTRPRPNENFVAKLTCFTCTNTAYRCLATPKSLMMLSLWQKNFVMSQSAALVDDEPTSRVRRYG